MKLAVLLAAALALPGCGAAEPPLPTPWVVFHQDAGGSVSLDTSRVRRDSAGAAVRLRIDYDAARPLPWGDRKGYQRVVLHTRLDCAAETSTDRLIDMQDRSGEPIATVEAPGAPRAFDDHPIGAWVFPPLCDFLRSRP